MFLSTNAITFVLAETTNFGDPTTVQSNVRQASFKEKKYKKWESKHNWTKWTKNDKEYVDYSPHIIHLTHLGLFCFILQ